MDLREYKNATITRIKRVIMINIAIDSSFQPKGRWCKFHVVRVNVGPLMASKRYGTILMVDTLTPEQRSERMSMVRDQGSKVDMGVRRLLHSLGLLSLEYTTGCWICSLMDANESRGP